LYQARYLVNDVRGRVEDNSQSTPKRRFPSKYVHTNGVPGSKEREEFALRLSYLSLICRLAIGITLFFTFAPPRYFTWLVCLIFLVSFTLATVAYELVRRATDQLFLKIMSGGDDYLLATDSRLLTFSSLSVVAVVGIGYAIRCLLGLWLLAGFSLRVQLFLGLFAWSYGSMFVYMTWIIESTKTSLTAFTSKAHLLSLGYPFRERFARIESRNSGASGVNAKDKVLSVSQSPWTVLVLLGAISQILMAFLLMTRIMETPQSRSSKFPTL